MFPLIITYEFLGPNIEGEEPQSEGDTYYFKYLPSFAPEEEIEGYSYATQASIEGVAHAFSEDHLAVLCDLDGLIAELAELRRRIGEVTGES